MNGYSVFLITKLATEMDVIDEKEAYDIMYGKGGELLVEFEKSLFNNENSSEYDCMHKFLKSKRFNFYDSFQKYLDGLNGININAMKLSHEKGSSSVVLTNGAVEIICTAFPFGETTLDFSVRVDKKNSGRTKKVHCPIPTDAIEFDLFTKFYYTRLMMAFSSFANVEEVTLDVDKKEYTVSGFLVPTQTISFEDYSDWDSIKGVNGEDALDCQIDFDEEYQFQYTDYNYDYDDGLFNLDDTQGYGRVLQCRNYRALVVDVNSETHPLTKKLIDTFYIKYSCDCDKYGDTKTIHELDEFIKRNVGKY